MGRYPITMDNAEVGWADIRRKGLFYEIQCDCNICSREPQRVCMVSKNARIKLGVLVPEKGRFTSSSRVAVRMIVDQPVQFVIEKHCTAAEEQIAPIQNEVTHIILSKLDRAYLKRIDGGTAMEFKE